MRPSTAHIALDAPFHHRHELTRNLLNRDPIPTITHRANGREPPHEPEPETVSADDQLWRHKDTAGLRGIPVIGAGPGAIPGTRPEGCLDRLASLQLLWLLAGSAASETAPALPPT